MSPPENNSCDDFDLIGLQLDFTVETLTAADCFLWLPSILLLLSSLFTCLSFLSQRSCVCKYLDSVTLTSTDPSSSFVPNIFSISALESVQSWSVDSKICKLAMRGSSNDYNVKHIV